MPEKVEALGILLVLLPGFACAYIVQLLAIRRKQTELDKVVEALLFSLILYVAVLPFFGDIIPVHWHTDPSHTDNYQILVDWVHLAILAGSALVFAVLYAASIIHDWLMALFRRVGATERTARSGLWNDIFQENEGWVQVGLSDGRSVLGWLRSYSDDASESSLFLERAAWVLKGKEGEAEEIAIDGPGILLTKHVGIEHVIFLGTQEEATCNDLGRRRSSNVK